MELFISNREKNDMDALIDIQFTNNEQVQTYLWLFHILNI